MKKILALLLLFPLALPAQTMYQDRVKAKTTVSIAPNATVLLYKTGEWSAWLRKEGVEYRYRWGLKTQESRYQTNLDAIYEVRNSSNAVWVGAARTLKCDTEQISGYSKALTLQAKETQTVTFLAPNCGTVKSPYFRENIVKSVRID